MTEVLAASLITALLAGGVIMSFLAAVRISERPAAAVEAASYAEQTLERYRNMVACDNSTWFTPACAPKLGLPLNDPDVIAGGPLQALGATRNYTVTPDDCDGDGTLGDCFKVTVNVHWTPLQ